MLKKIAKIIGIIVLSLAIVATGLYLLYDKPLPKGEQSTQADELASKMLKAINHTAYDSTRFLSWGFGGRNYVWDKQQDIVDIIWEKKEVRLFTKTPDQSKVSIGGQEIAGDLRREIIADAISRFNNDSFWLVAPHKVFDPETERRLVTMEDGEEALLVTYTSGGSTPGDSYLWLLDDTGRPRAWRLWVSILPIGGIESSWEGWETTESGALLSTKHSMLAMELHMEDVKGWNEPASIDQ